MTSLAMKRHCKYGLQERSCSFNYQVRLPDSSYRAPCNHAALSGLRNRLVERFLCEIFGILTSSDSILVLDTNDAFPF